MSDETFPGSGTAAHDERPEPAPELNPSAANRAAEPPIAEGAESTSDSTLESAARKRRRRGSRGGRSRTRAAGDAASATPESGDGEDQAVSGEAPAADLPSSAPAAGQSANGQAAEGRSPAAEGRRQAGQGRTPAAPVPARTGGTANGGSVDISAPLVPSVPPPRPKIGDTRPAPATTTTQPAPAPRSGGRGAADDGPKRRRRGGRSKNGQGTQGPGNGNGAPAGRPVEAVLFDEPVELDEETLERRRGRERKGRPVGRYTMVVHARKIPGGPGAGGSAGSSVTQIAVLEGRSLIEHYVSRPTDDANQIDGNIYLGRVQNVLPGMEAAFIDIGTPKNAVLYRGDVRYDKDDIETPSGADAKPTRGKLPGLARDARIEQLLKTGQTILCQVTKNPIGTKGARLTQEVSLPGRFVVLIPHSDTYGISKRLADDERKRLRRILDEVRPAGHGLIVRTAAEGATADELRRDVARLTQQWEQIEQMAKTTRAPALLYREPDMAVRVIREEFNRNYRAVVIDDRALFEEVRDYVGSINPELADRIEWAGDSDDPLPVFERYHVHEQIHKALDRKVWLPSGGSLIIERTEALTVIDVNTGKNVGTSNLEETVFRNNLEAAEEIARQVRLRDIGGIIVIDFIDMEIAANRNEVIKTFRAALARDKTRTQVFDISELGLVEMTRKRISEGLVESFSETCPTCGGRGIVFDESLL
jgi:ribonuclease E